jgi:hypothetical protein
MPEEHVTVVCTECGHLSPAGTRSCPRCSTAIDSTDSPPGAADETGVPDQNAASDQTVFSNQSPAADKTVISNQSPAPDRTVASDPDRATDRTLVSDQTTTTALSSASKPRRRAASEDSSESRLPVGTVLAQRYEVKSVLGTGGMGAVYKVFDRRLSRLVALKTIHPQLASTPEIMRRFTQEVLLAQKVVHKNVVRIFDIGDDGPTHFITMDLIEGVSLKDLILERGKFAPEEAIAVIREVCHALAAAHAEGIVHRDLKPSPPGPRRRGRFWGRPTTCRPSRRGWSPWTPVPTSSPWA